jgi:hypothetical protein
MKEIKRDAAKMYEEAQKMKAIEQQLEMLYEQVGMRLERYFEIADSMNENPQITNVSTNASV